jgi:hypothetical protein
MRRLVRVALLCATGALVLALTGPVAAMAAPPVGATGATGATARSGSTASTASTSTAPSGRAGGTGAPAAATPTTTYVPSGGTPAATTPTTGATGTSTPTTGATGTPGATTSATTPAQALLNKRFGKATKATAHKKRHIGTPAIVIAAVAVLVALACAAWALARHRAYEPHWWLSLRHAMAEAGFRASATWAEFTDWARLGR